MRAGVSPRAVQFVASLAVIPAKAGIREKPQGRSVGWPWMPTVVGITLRR